MDVGEDTIWRSVVLGSPVRARRPVIPHVPEWGTPRNRTSPEHRPVPVQRAAPVLTVPVHLTPLVATHASAQAISTRTLLRGDRVHDARRPPTVARGGAQSHLEWKGYQRDNLIA